jgi:hypothetical protein
MASQKDKDYHKLRNPEKYGLDHATYPLTTKDAEADKAYNALWYKFGGRSLVGDKRRRNSTRKSNQNFKRVKGRIDRARGKEEVKQLISKI